MSWFSRQGRLHLWRLYVWIWPCGERKSQRDHQEVWAQAPSRCRRRRRHPKQTSVQIHERSNHDFAGKKNFLFGPFTAIFKLTLGIHQYSPQYAVIFLGWGSGGGFELKWQPFGVEAGLIPFSVKKCSWNCTCHLIPWSENRVRLGSMCVSIRV